MHTLVADGSATMSYRMRFLGFIVLFFGTGSIAGAQSPANLRVEPYVVQTRNERIDAELGRFDVPENYGRPSSKNNIWGGDLRHEVGKIDRNLNARFGLWNPADA